MKKTYFLNGAALGLSLVLSTSVCASALLNQGRISTPYGLLMKIADGIAYPPPPGTVRPEFNQENVQAEVDLQLQEKYDAATKNGTKPLTAERANATGWGFIADNFAAIDSNKNGTAGLNEIAAYLDGRSAVPVQRKATSTVHTVE